jgi:hypothetical protein
MGNSRHNTEEMNAIRAAQEARMAQFHKSEAGARARRTPDTKPSDAATAEGMPVDQTVRSESSARDEATNEPE